MTGSHEVRGSIPLFSTRPFRAMAQAIVFFVVRVFSVSRRSPTQGLIIPGLGVRISLVAPKNHLGTVGVLGKAL